jgi:hypothetical protein
MSLEGAGIALGYGLDDRGFESQEGHPDSYPMSARGSFLGGTVAGA